MDRDSFCSHCGTPYTDTSRYPRACAACGRQVWANPAPVAVVLLPVVDGDRTGLLVVRRAIPPVGRLALVGGFVEAGETWQQGVARELWEEAMVRVDASTLRPLWYTSTEPAADLVLLFSLAPPVQAADLGPFEPNDEASERTVIFEPQELAFPLHTELARQYLSGALEVPPNGPGPHFLPA
jgi:ADP-ribose pyrophosphatase YjhB (NUDIX family)